MIIAPRNVLLSMDDLFDTRFAFLMSLDPMKTYKHYSIWKKRDSDQEVWEAYGLTEKQWVEKWEKRESNFFRKAIRSTIYTILFEIIMDSGRTAPNEGNAPSIGLTINTHPYYLTQSEKEAIGSYIRYFIHPLLKIRWVRMSKKEITPIWLVNSASFVIMYDWQDWMLAQINPKDDEQAVLQSVTFIVPKLLPSKLEGEDKELFVEMIKNGIDSFQLTEAYIAPSMTIRYVNRGYWDFPPTTKEKQKDEG